MWDLDTLHAMNERAVAEAHQRAVERANLKTSESPKPQPQPVFPLSILAGLLITGPPSINHLINLLENSESITEFLELVRDYVPEYENEIMGADLDDRIIVFQHYFEQRYFPLSDNLELREYEIGDFVREIPVDLMGFSYDDYHEFNDYRSGYVLILSLVESPYIDDVEGGRVPILEEAANLVGKHILELIPREGWPLEDLHKMLDKTEYSGVATFADWIHANTGCWVLDATYEEYSGEPWHRDTVEVLTEQWPKVVSIQKKIQETIAWLEEDTRNNFTELLACILNRKDLIVPKEQLALPLDENAQVIRKEVTADGRDKTNASL